jgi:2-oxoglutarate ferredoxin oxidoreductase subunit beta
MTKRNPEYDFKWCPGCGDFGVKRAIELTVKDRTEQLNIAMEDNVIVAGIGCSGNLVHLTDGPQPFGFHGIHGRTLPVAFGVKSANPKLQVLVVAGDGDFLSIGAEHIGPQAKRNLDITCVIMDNGVYGLTKGQSSPTTQLGVVTSTTPGGKIEEELKPFPLYLSLGVSFVASAFSSKPKEMASMIRQAMDYKGFSIVHIQSPCTTYNDTYDVLRGNVKKGIDPLTYELPEDYDPTDLQSAFDIVTKPGIPLGVLYAEGNPKPLNARFDSLERDKDNSDIFDLLNGFAIK